MPYSFVEIEKEKRWIVRAVFLFLLLFYFLVAEVLWLVTKLYFLFKSIVVYEKSLFSWSEAGVVFAVALVVALIHWRVSTHGMIGKIMGLLGARVPDPNDSYHRMFTNVVDEVSVATGGHAIQGYVIPSSSLNAFAIADFQGNGVIGVTEGLLAKLSRGQLEAVVGHEAAHLVSEDSLTTTVTCSLFGIYSALLAGARIAIERGPSYGRRDQAQGGWLFLLIIFLVLSITQTICLLLNMFLSRQKETRADAVAVRLTRDPVALAEALYIISRGWRGIGGVPDSLGPIFIMTPDYKTLEESEGFIADLFSTHPPVKRRLDMLLGMAHADPSILPRSAAEKRRVSPEEGVVPVDLGTNRGWLFYKDNSWQGPFGLEKLLELGLSPSSWVAEPGDKRTRQASEVEALHNALRDKLAGRPVSETVICPHCKQPLGEVLYEGVPALKCLYCEGIFAPSTSVLRIMVREEIAFPPSIVKTAELALKEDSADVYRAPLRVAYELSCPKCHEKMARGFYSSGYPVMVDRCERCQYVWFDKGELETLQYIFEKFNPAGTA